MTKSNLTMSVATDLVVVIPAAGVGSRMGANKPKQYLPLAGQTILQKTVKKFLNLEYVAQVVIAISKSDPYFDDLKLAEHPKVTVVDGGNERADSVSNGIAWAKQQGFEWVLVHDAARPCVIKDDVDALVEYALTNNRNAILGARAKDTFKRSLPSPKPSTANIDSTVDRNDLWHAFTPQCCKVGELFDAMAKLTNDQGQLDKRVTDEASALELVGHTVDILESSPNNIKITVPEDLPLAEFYWQLEQNSVIESS